MNFEYHPAEATTFFAETLLAKVVATSSFALLVEELTAKLAYAGNEAARLYLDGKINADQAAEWLTKYALYSPARAKQRVRFTEKYRSYVINYNLGKDLVKQYVEGKSGGDANKRWETFADLLSSPRLPGGLR